MREEDYRKIEGFRATQIKAGAASMAAMHAEITWPEEPETESQKLGIQAHLVILEPHRIDELVVSKSAAETRALKKEAADPRMIVSERNREKLRRMVDAFMANGRAAQLLNESRHEVLKTFATSTWKGKARLDMLALNGTWFADYKTCGDVAPHGFTQQFSKGRYDIQFGVYWHAAGEPQEAYCIAQSTIKPYRTAIHPVTYMDCVMWWRDADYIVSQYQEACKACRWPYGVEVYDPIVLPATHGNDCAVDPTINDEGGIDI